MSRTNVTAARMPPRGDGTVLADATGRGRGFTLIEMMLVLLCMFLLLGPIWRILRSGTQMSLKGMLQVETTLEARRIIRQVYTDLKSACIRFDGSQRVDLEFDQVVVKAGDPPAQALSFLAFPSHGSVTDAVPGAPGGVALRRASRITYTLEKSQKPDKPFMRLTRTEAFHPDHPLAKQFPGGKQSRVLSEKVHYFALTPRTYETGGQSLYYFWITLQLADSLQARNLPTNQIGSPMIQRPQGVIIADFFEVVYPEYFNSLIGRNGFNLNWHSGVVGP